MAKLTKAKKRKKQKVAVVVTVKNEKKSLTPLLDSLVDQTYLPDEIIIVDGGSEDGTREILKGYSSQETKSSIRIIEALGANRSKGRNIGIQAADSPIVAITDAGCIAETEWLERISLPIRKGQAEVVAGFYTMKVDTEWQRVFSLFLGTLAERFVPETFLPSSRSLALTKQTWRQAGKYPERLNTCEDLVFAAQLKKAARMTVVPQARVIWTLPGNVKAFFRQVREYARGDVEARYWPHVRKIGSVWLRYGLFILLPPLFGVYLLVKSVLLGKYIPGKSWWRIPVVQGVSDMAVMVGSLSGLFLKGRD